MSVVHKAYNIYKQEGIVFLADEILKQFSESYWAKREIGQEIYDLSDLIKSPSPTIIDGGANRGHTIQKFLQIFPEGKVFAFEPIPEACIEIRQKFPQKNVEIYQVALGEESGTASFTIQEKSRWSSFHNLANNAPYNGEAKKTIETKIVRLDQEIDESVDILKLDLQGYEIHALRGATGVLDDISAILTEVQFTPYYEQGNLFCDIHEFLIAEGFVLFNFYDLRSREDVGGRLEWGDALYLNTSKFPEVVRAAPD